MTTSTTNDYEQRLSNFYSVLNQTLHSHREATRRLDRFLSTGFNVFTQVIRPDEDRLSEIIADLLNPSGSHGQQRRFLDAFLQIIERPELKDKKLLKVDSQVQTDRNTENPRGKIDILVKFENFGLGIENKLWAVEQPMQLKRYLDHLKNEFGANGFRLVFITPYGHKPNSIEFNERESLMNEKKLICVSYNHDMLKWVEECCHRCESDKFRWFLRDFMNYMIDKFPTYDVEVNDVESS